MLYAQDMIIVKRRGNENSDEISDAVETNYTSSNMSIHSVVTKSAAYNSCAGRNKNVWFI